MSEPAENEEELNRSYQVGISVGLEQAASYLMELAIEDFKRSGYDSNLLKKISIELNKRSDAAHPLTKEIRSLD